MNTLEEMAYEGMEGGGEDPASPLTPQQMKDWNSYVDYVKKRGYEGSKELDKKDTGLAKKLFEDFLKENPSVSIKYEDVSKVQTEMIKLKDSVQDFAKRRNDPDAEKRMAGVSQVDGWPGSKTTRYKFPEMNLQAFHNDNLVEKKNLGLVGGDMKPTGQNAIQKQLPKGVKLEKLQDGYYYENEEGDLVKWQ